MDTQEIFDTARTWITYGLFGGSYVPFLYIMRKTLNRIKWKSRRVVSKIVWLLIYTAALIALGIAVGVVDINSIRALIR